ncbi:MAG: HAD family hydrolase [Selenomonadaceae bacterium]|nr:HAD family hydrolase [Selenomonadaceae bacterium]
MGTKAVFFDRDGTLNVDVHYLHRPEDFHWIPGAQEAISYVKKLGYLAIVITNQSGVARGFYPETDIVALHDWMNRELAKVGASLDDIFYCPHHPEGKIPQYTKKCACRKPGTLLIDDACERYDIDREGSFFVGDAVSDMECAKAAGVKGIRYTGGNLYELLRQEIRQ